VFVPGHLAEVDMKRLVAGLALIIGTAALSGCYYDPGYSYVRSSGYQGDAYYGDGGYVAPAYYGSGYYGPDYYGGYAPGVSVDIGTVWYGGSRGHYRGRDYDDYRWRGGGHDRGWERGRGGGARYEQRGGESHRGGGHGGGGGSHGGGHDHHDGH
jgi:hypothetical protein